MLSKRSTIFMVLFSRLALHCLGETRLRIINGTTVRSGEFPYIVSLQTKGEHFCGGTIVEKDVVVTAGHCIRDIAASEITVVAGVINLKTAKSFKSSKSQTLGVTLAVPHPCFKWPHLGSDIGLLTLNGSFTYNKWVNAAVIAPDLYAPTGNGIIAGWGATREGGSNSNRLIQATVNVLEPVICSDHYGDEVDSTNFCAAPSTSTEDACQGDSGGPLICSSGYFCGVISGGAGCGVPDYPGVYTNVGCFTTWIVLEKYQHRFNEDEKFGSNCTENQVSGEVVMRKLERILLKNHDEVIETSKEEHP